LAFGYWLLAVGFWLVTDIKKPKAESEQRAANSRQRAANSEQPKANKETIFFTTKTNNMSLLRQLFGPSKKEIWRQLSEKINATFVDGG